ncbi:MAG: hypothetical protein EBQ80_00115, partial [Proteobacteria bacterium]|nr:hypothetical protein [Pseudomonadota bacterium]
NLTGSPLISTSMGGVVSATNVYAGTVSATNFVGNGSGLTGISVAAQPSDRISTTGVASGANLGMVAASIGTVSFTTGGTAGTAYLDTVGRYIGPGISLTAGHGISSTNGYFAGRVGIGTNSPTAVLQVSGDIVTTVNNAGSGTSIDWSTSNVAYTSANCGSFTFTNMRDGGAYTLVVKGATAATCSFSQTGLTFKMPVGHGATTVSKHTVYSFIRAGTDVYVTWIKGY